jgi:hypothetical protein
MSGTLGVLFDFFLLGSSKESARPMGQIGWAGKASHCTSGVVDLSRFLRDDGIPDYYCMQGAWLK